MLRAILLARRDHAGSSGTLVGDIKVNKGFKLPARSLSELPRPQSRRSTRSAAEKREAACRHNWRISTFNGALLAAYFIPTWTIVAFKIMISPIHGFYERPNISVALFVSDHLQFAAMTTVRLAWLLALGKLTVVAFFAIFLVFITRAAIRKTGGCDEALAMALAIGSIISFASMMMASQVGETEALRLHATELLLLLGTAIVLLVERPVRPQADQDATSADLPLQQSQFPHNR